MIAPIECVHSDRIFIQSGNKTSTETSSRERITLCSQCGTFFVSVVTDGQHFFTQFTLVTEAQLEAAKKAVDFYANS